MTFVIDASLTLAWCFKDESSAYATTILKQLPDSRAVTPSIWPLEVANALLVGERRKRLTKADTARFLALLRSLPITVDDETTRRALGGVLSLARDQGLSSYDASYLEVAMRRGCSIATLDDRLQEAATKLGITIVEG